MLSTTVTYFLLLLVARVAYGQSIHVVNVGDTGSFYDPPVTSALKGDIVNFRFTGMFHSITQSSFNAPCTPVPGGFDSGVAGTPAQTIAPIKEWNLTITDDSQPIWFFCKLTMPIPHCTSGMVGAINAVTNSTNQSFDLFLQAAKALPSESPAPSGFVLTGVGAFATATPMVRAGSNTTTSTSTSMNTSTSATSATSSITSTTATPTPLAAKSTGLSGGAKGGIAGGIVGGALILILLVLLFLSYRRGRRLRREAAINKTLHSNSSRDMSQYNQPNLLHGGGLAGSGISSPRQQDAYPRSGTSIADSMEQDSTAGPSINIKELAAEIATHMRQESASAAERAPPAQPHDTGGLPTVHERPGAVTTSSTGRQLPRPPLSSAKRPDDARSVDTLPAYVSGR